MRIGIFLQDLKSGGAEKMMVGFANYLATQTDDEVFLILVRDEGPYKSFLNPNINVVVLNKKKTLYSFFALASALKKLKVDYLYSTLVNANILALMVSKYTGQKLIIREANTISEDRRTEPRRLIRIANSLTQYLYKWAYKCISISNNVKKDLTEFTNIDADKISVIYNPIIIIDDKKVEVDTSKFNVAMVSRLTIQKNIVTICKIIEQVLQTDNNIVFHFFGEGDASGLKALQEKYNAHNKIVLHGFNLSYFSYVKQMNLFMHIPIWEGLGNSVLEVFNSGIPMILADINSGYSELILKEYNNIHYFTPTDVDSIKNCILQYQKGEIKIIKERIKLDISESNTYKAYRELSA